MNKLAFLTMIAASAVFFACGNEFSSPFYDQLTDEQKEMLSVEGFKVQQCLDFPLEELNPNDSIDTTLWDLRIDLANLNVFYKTNASFETIKTVERPFSAATYNEPFDDNTTLFYFYSGLDKNGYSFQIKNDWYEEIKEALMPEAVELQIFHLESQDWRTLTTPEEQFVTVMTALMTRPDLLASLVKFTTITIDGKPHRVFTYLVHK